MKSFCWSIDYSFLKRILFFLAVLSWISLVLNGFFPNVEMFLFSGKVIGIFRPRLFFLLTSILLCFACPPKIPSKLLIPFVAFLGYLAVEILYFKFNGYSPRLIFEGFKSYYANLLLVPLFLVFRGYLSQISLMRWLKITFILVAILAGLQLAFNASVFPTRSCDGVYEVYSWDFYRHARVFSLFSSPMEFSMFLVLFVTLIANEYFPVNSNFVGFVDWRRLIFLLLPIFFIYVSYLRTGYVLLLFSMLFLVICHRFSPDLIIKKYLMEISLISGVILVAALAFNVSTSSISRTTDEIYSSAFLQNGPIYKSSQNSCEKFRFWRFDSLSGGSMLAGNPFNSDSFLIRLAEWNVCFRLLSKDIRTALLGTGFTQGKIGYKFPLPIDNVYIAIALQIGFVGLFVFLWLLRSIIAWMLSFSGVDSPCSLGLPVTAVFLGVIVASMFNLLVFGFLLYLLLPVMAFKSYAGSPENECD